MRILLRDHTQSRWLWFSEPTDVVEARTLDDVVPALELIEQRVQAEELHAAGYVAYEAAGGFDPAQVTRVSAGSPLLLFGLFPAAVSRDRLDPPAQSAAMIGNWRIAVTRADYARNIAAIREQIAAGNTYQVNYTIRSHADQVPDSWDLFHRNAADAPYAAHIETDDHAVVSASPELFFRLEEDRLVCKPMKGTARRGMTPDDDCRLRRALFESTKDRAENVMIADMIRNDMGRIADPGSVVAEKLYCIEKYRTVWQMTSKVSARTNAGVADIFGALFPCASVTGAPKISSMNIIARLEDSPRGVYTGAIGFIAPGRRAQFSVAIRTALLDRKSRQAVYGTGGGIVWNSDADSEYGECLAKTRILYQESPAGFELLETLRWTRSEGYFLLDAHLRRMRASAAYFDMAFDEPSAMRVLDARASGFDTDRMRVRLLLAHDGELRTTADSPQANDDAPPCIVRLARRPVDVDDPFLYHKTTWRRCYERAMAETEHCDDVLLWNRDGFITETTIANVAVRIDGRLCTPPVSCGLLAGTYRESLLANGEIGERTIHVSELPDGLELSLFNAVRGRYSGRLVVNRP